MLSLRLATLIALSAALLLALGPRLAQAEQIESFEIAGWSGGVIADDDGRFSHCRLSAEYYSDITLGFMMGEAGLVIPLGRDAEALRRLKQGHLLEVDARHDTFGFELTGTLKALSLLERCVQRRLYADSLNPFGGPSQPGRGDPVGGGFASNPFGSETPQASPDAEDWTYRDFVVTPHELRDFLTTASGGSEVHVVSPDAGDAVVNFDVEGIGGTYFELPTDEEEPDATMAFRIVADSLAKHCRGRVGSGTLDRARSDELDLVRGFFACDAPDGYIAMIAISESYLDSFLTLAAPRGRQSATEALGRKLFSALLGSGSYEGVNLLLD